MPTQNPAHFLDGGNYPWGFISTDGKVLDGSKVDDPLVNEHAKLAVSAGFSGVADALTHGWTRFALMRAYGEGLRLIATIPEPVHVGAKHLKKIAAKLPVTELVIDIVDRYGRRVGVSWVRAEDGVTMEYFKEKVAVAIKKLQAAMRGEQNPYTFSNLSQAVYDLSEKSSETENFNYYGIRKVSKGDPAVVGLVLGASRRGGDHEGAGKGLSGTSVIGIPHPNYGGVDDVSERLDILAKYPGDRIVLLGSDNAQLGEDQHEMEMQGAKVLGVWEAGGEAGRVSNPISDGERDPRSDQYDGDLYYLENHPSGVSMLDILALQRDGKTDEEIGHIVVQKAGADYPHHIGESFSKATREWMAKRWKVESYQNKQWRYEDSFNTKEKAEKEASNFRREDYRVRIVKPSMAAGRVENPSYGGHDYPFKLHKKADDLYEVEFADLYRVMVGTKKIREEDDFLVWMWQDAAGQHGEARERMREVLIDLSLIADQHTGRLGGAMKFVIYNQRGNILGTVSAPNRAAARDKLRGQLGILKVKTTADLFLYPWLNSAKEVQQKADTGLTIQ